MEYEIRQRVYYKDTDCGGVVYYTRYAEFMEIGRTELLRSLKWPASKLVDEFGIICPIVDMQIKYHKSAVYDDNLKVITKLKKVSAVRILFEYRILNQDDELLVTGITTNCSVDVKTLKPVRLPREFVTEISKFVKAD